MRADSTYASSLTQHRARTTRDDDGATNTTRMMTMLRRLGWKTEASVSSSTSGGNAIIPSTTALDHHVRPRPA